MLISKWGDDAVMMEASSGFGTREGCAMGSMNGTRECSGRFESTIEMTRSFP
jgi:hypothetical protein